ncbi:hypothetical protein A3715_32475 [Oleiphilus sp. HI0009]|nr:hypothetical protein A3715_15530 [Oleiphilus sp. HI0009]KZX83269.1 hypothetical protein A3715_32475 [Oleiphilus sp. HI0009]
MRFKPYYSELTDELALEILHDVQSSLECSLFEARLEQASRLSEPLITLISDVVDYVNNDGDERENFEEWVGENEADLKPIVDSEEFSKILKLLHEGEDVPQDKVDELARNTNLRTEERSIDWSGHIYPKLLQLEDMIKRQTLFAV